MKELSLNILDIAQNSLAANSSRVCIQLDETNETLRITVSDDGVGMSDETVKKLADPFFTTRKTRKVGLGIPFFTLAAEQTGGGVSISSKQASSDSQDHGTVISGLFYKNHIDFTPLGDIIDTVCTLVQSCGGTDIVFTHNLTNGSVQLDTAELRAVLGEVPLSTPDVLVWARDYLRSAYDEIKDIK